MTTIETMIQNGTGNTHVKTAPKKGYKTRDHGILKIILAALKAAKKPITPQANLYRIYGDCQYRSLSEDLAGIEEAEIYIKKLMEAI